MIKKLFLNDQSLHIFVFTRRVTWATTALFYQLLILFLESLVDTRCLTYMRNKIFSLISIFFISTFMLFGFFNYDCLGPTEKHWFEIAMHKTSFFYILLIMIVGIFIIFKKLRISTLSKIVKKQTYILMFGIIIPYWLFDVMQVLFSSFFTLSSHWTNSNYALISLSTLCINFALIYCSRAMMGLRFLNWHSHVKETSKQDFATKFQTVLTTLRNVTALPELTHITHHFFKEAFGVGADYLLLVIGADKQSFETENKTRTLISANLSSFPAAMHAFMKEHTILVSNELSYDKHYESSPESDRAFDLLENVNADIFLPIYINDSLSAYIVIKKNARRTQFYSHAECHEMFIFGQYLSTVIYKLQSPDIKTLRAQEKSLQEELYAKQEESRLYKNIIRSFIHGKYNNMGVIFYTNRQFSFGNKVAADLIQIDPNETEGHLCSKALRKLVRYVESYKERQTVSVKNDDGITLVLTALPSGNENIIIINVHYPHLIDEMKKHLDSLKGPSEWDYTLYLETTESGKLVNTLIPGNGQELIDFKIELLKTALGKKATLLSLPDNDLEDAVHLLHHISRRNTLHVLHLKSPTPDDYAIELFGINSLFNGNTAQTPLLEKLNDIGTLYIKNIHYLDAQSQIHLAEFLRYGFFHSVKGTSHITSNVRIICSTDRDLSRLVFKEKFNRELFNQLNQTTLTMPSLSTLSDVEFKMLFEAIREQVIEKNETYQDFLHLSKKEKKQLLEERAISIHALRLRINEILIKRSKETNIYEETTFDNDPNNVDSVVALAKRMGKKTLYYANIMKQLAQKFNNNQNKIAKLLGVNRSSVCRYFKKYKIIE